MDFETIRRDLRAFNFETLRSDCDNFLEGVIATVEAEKLNLQLKTLLGEPVYPSKDRLTHKIKQAIDGFGGIMPGQTLYFKELGKDSILAMLWPWKDGEHTTVKLIHKQEGVHKC